MPDWRVLPSPWSAVTTDQTAVDVGERPLLLVDPSVTSIRARAQRIRLPKLGERQIDGRRWSVFELSSTGLDAQGSERLDLEAEQGRQQSRFQIELSGGLRFDPGSGGQEDDGVTRPVGQAERVYGLLGRHVDLIYEAVKKSRASTQGVARLDLPEFLLNWRKSDDVEKARRALIVKIAETVSSTVAGIADRPRRVLRRLRSMERAASVRQIDPAGIRWLVRQPGRTLAERAGPRQRVLAVTREETVDTHENRVMRDFLDRSASECRLWLRDNVGFEGTERWELVDRYGSAVRRWRRMSELADVRPARGTVHANYVLQHDARYSRIWPLYQELRRRQEQEDQMWRWSHRTLAEALRLALVWAIDELEEEAGLANEGSLYEHPLLLHGEQRFGQFVHERTPFAGWIFSAGGRLRSLAVLSGDRIAAFERRFATGTRLSELAPDAVVVAHDPYTKTGPFRFLAVWSRLRFGLGDGGADPILDIGRAVAGVRGQARVEAALIEPVQAAEEGAESEIRHVPAPQGSAIAVHRYAVSLRPARARRAFLPLIREALLSESWS